MKGFDDEHTIFAGTALHVKLLYFMHGCTCQPLVSSAEVDFLLLTQSAFLTEASNSDVVKSHYSSRGHKSAVSQFIVIALVFCCLLCHPHSCNTLNTFYHVQASHNLIKRNLFVTGKMGYIKF